MQEVTTFRRLSFKAYRSVFTRNKEINAYKSVVAFATKGSINLFRTINKQ